MKKFKSKCGNFDITVDDEDYQKVIDFAPNGWNVRYTTGGNYPYVTTRKTINGKRKFFYLHRVVMDLWDSSTPHIDHIKTEDKLDNRKSNLRIVTRSQNMSNRQSKKTSVSDYLGVSFCQYKKTKKYRVELQRQDLNGGKKIHMGYYDDDIQAGYAYNCAAKIIHGEYANLNQINSEDVNNVNTINENIEKRLRSICNVTDLVN